jgi:PAS domain S-box-containing protein
VDPISPHVEDYAARLAAIVASADDAIVSKTLDGIITSWNGAAERMFGYTEAEVLGRSITIIIPHERLHEEDEIIRRLRHGEAIEHFETERLTKDGRLIPISLTVSPIRDGHGRVIGASKIARDVSERKRLEAEREEARRRERVALAQARLANQAKDEFLAMLAHELRNPVGVITNALAVLERQAAGPQHDRARSLIGRQANHLARLLDDLLDVARIGGRQIELERVPVDLRATLGDAAEAERHRLEGKRQHLTLSLGSAPVIVVGDPVRLQQIAGNLLNNASKYTPSGGTISLTLGVEDERAVVTVTDNGPGIPADKLDAIFDLFVQVNPTLARTEGGLGIGLTLVKHLVELHGGEVRASLAGPDGGARFTVRLPVVRGATALGPSPAARTPARAQRVLVVEDNDDAREMLAALLRLLGHEVFEAGTGAAALDLARDHPPAVVIMDIGLPDLDGYEVARRLRQRLGADVRLVALSGYGQPQDRARASGAGFDEHLVKPVDPVMLDEVIQGGSAGAAPTAASARDRIVGR